MTPQRRCDLRVNEYTAFCNGPDGPVMVKSPRVIVTPPS